MTIGIDASRANLEHKTGVEFYSYFLIQELKKIISPEHRVFLYSPEPLQGDLAKLGAGWEWRQVTTPFKIPFRGKRPLLWTQIGLSLEMLRRPPDVLFVPSHALPFICPKNSFVTIHDIGFLRFRESYHPIARLYHRFSTWFALARARKIIAISEFTKKELIEAYHADHKKIEVIPIAYDATRFHANLDEVKKQEVLKKYSLIPSPQSSPFLRGRKEGDEYFFYVGRLEKKKNITTLIKAFEIINLQSETRNLQLVLAGSPAFGFDEIQATIRNSPVRDLIKILNYVDEEDLPYLMSGAVVFVFPSLYEGFGIPILEAMAVGTPVVAADILALREIATPISMLSLSKGEEATPMAGQGGGSAALFADPNDPQDFAEKIHQVLTSQTLRESLVATGLEQAKKYSWEKTAAQTLEVLTL